MLRRERRSDYAPADSEKFVHLALLGHPLLERGDEGVALAAGLILDLENPLPQPPLLLLQLLELTLELMLFEGGPGTAGEAAEPADLLF